MAGEITSHTFFQAASKLIHRVYNKSAKKIQPVYEELFNVVTPDMKRPFYSILPYFELGTMAVKPEGAPPAFDQPGELAMTTLNFITYALAYKITEEGALEDPYNLIARLPEMLAYSSQISIELILSLIFNQAFTNGVNGADGVPLCSTAHPLGTMPGQTVSNSAGTTALSPDSLMAALIAYMTLVNDRNLPSYRTPVKLVASPFLYKPVEEIISTKNYPYTNENRINVMYEKLEPFLYRFLTSQTAWFIMAAKGDLLADSHSLMVLFKWKDKIREWMDGATGNTSQRSSNRLAYGWGDWRGFYGSQGS